MEFKSIQQSHRPAGDQPDPFINLDKSLLEGANSHTLLGVQRVGQTFTIANSDQQVRDSPLSYPITNRW